MEPDVAMEHRSECYEPAYDERPTIKFIEVWGDHAWKVEYYGKYDNKRETKRTNGNVRSAYLGLIRHGSQI